MNDTSSRPHRTPRRPRGLGIPAVLAATAIVVSSGCSVATDGTGARGAGRGETYGTAAQVAEATRVDLIHGLGGSWWATGDVFEITDEVRGRVFHSGFTTTATPPSHGRDTDPATAADPEVVAALNDLNEAIGEARDLAGPGQLVLAGIAHRGCLPALDSQLRAPRQPRVEDADGIREPADARITVIGEPNPDEAVIDCGEMQVSVAVYLAPADVGAFAPDPRLAEYLPDCYPACGPDVYHPEAAEPTPAGEVAPDAGETP